jgi:hypothetical protein
VPSQQLQGQLQTQHSGDTDNNNKNNNYYYYYDSTALYYALAAFLVS